MNLIFCTEARFVRFSDTSVYSIDGGLTDEVLQRYLSRFEHVYVMARVCHDCNMKVNPRYRISDCRISFIDLPYYIGPIQYLKVRQRVQEIMRANVRRGQVYICRVPGQIGGLMAYFLRKERIPFGVEVVGDPWDVFARGGVHHPLRIFFRYRGYWQLKKIVQSASAVLYVTEHQLQHRYPASDEAYQVVASNVRIQISDLPVKCNRICKNRSYTLLSVGSLEQMYKAPDIVLKALCLLKKRQLDFHLYWLGEGKYKKELIELAEKLSIGDVCTFVGNVTRQEVYRYLNESDIFLMVSRTEGLPRALVEAMAMGLPCIGSNVGGIPELLDKEMIVPKEDAEALANKIEYLLTHIDVANQQAERNYKEAQKYYEPVLQKKRVAFFEHLISISQK